MKEQTACYDAKALRRGYLSLLLRIAVLAAALGLFFSMVCMLWRVQGQDMVPAVRDGDLLLAWRMGKDFGRGDVVVYQAEGQRRVGRVAALGGDAVEITEDGKLLVNNAIQSESIYYPTQTEQGELSLSLPEGSLYILGDYRTACRDSRDFGPVPAESIEGKVIGLLRVRGF